MFSSSTNVPHQQVFCSTDTWKSDWKITASSFNPERFGKKKNSTEQQIWFLKFLEAFNTRTIFVFFLNTGFSVLPFVLSKICLIYNFTRATYSECNLESTSLTLPKEFSVKGMQSWKSLDGITHTCTVNCMPSSHFVSLPVQHKFVAVMHLAGLKAVGESCELPLLYYKTNVGGTMNLLEVSAWVYHGLWLSGSGWISKKSQWFITLQNRMT